MRHTFPSALRAATVSVLGLSAGFFTTTAFGGPTLVSRDSTVRASGVTPQGEYDLSNGSGDFEPFADDLHSDSAAAARSMARQSSRPLLEGDSGDFAGASADGAAKAAVDVSDSDIYATAQSDFDVVFRVDAKPA